MSLGLTDAKKEATMTKFSQSTDTGRQQRAAFVPTLFLAEFVAGARDGLEIDARYGARCRRPDLIETGLDWDELPRAA
jgi:hypothetical protein